MRAPRRDTEPFSEGRILRHGTKEILNKAGLGTLEDRWLALDIPDADWDSLSKEQRSPRSRPRCELLRTQALGQWLSKGRTIERDQFDLKQG